MLSLSSSLLPRVCLARALLCFSLLPRVCLVCKLVFLQLGQCLCQGASFWQGILTESSKALLLARNLHLPGALWQGVFILSCWWCSKASRVALAVQGHFTDFLNVCISLSFFSMRSMTSCKCRNSRDVSLPAHILRSSPCFSLRLSTLILTQRPPFHLLWLRAGCSIKTCIAACLRFPGCISAVDSKVTSSFIKGSTFSSAFIVPGDLFIRAQISQQFLVLCKACNQQVNINHWFACMPGTTLAHHPFVKGLGNPLSRD